MMTGITGSPSTAVITLTARDRMFTRLYSSVPPSSPSTTIILMSLMFWYRQQWSDSVLPGNTSPPMAMPARPEQHNLCTV
jgi:hypothetical protein